ncbi:MAG: CAP domain-containing protein [Verrucomicrobiales bacterium]
MRNLRSTILAVLIAQAFKSSAALQGASFGLCGPARRAIVRISILGVSGMLWALSCETGTAQPALHESAEVTELEQLTLELVNRARANPGAEATRLGISLNQDLAPGTISNTPKQPLASHQALVNAAGAHSQWMLDTNTFSHTGQGGASWQQRMASAGYPFSGLFTSGENIAWTGTTGALDLVSRTFEAYNALFLSSSHRPNILLAQYEELGVGVRSGVFTSNGTDFNALMMTQDFARSDGTPGPLLTGVVYYDFNGNGFYDPGEGISGIRVDVQGGSHYTETATAGGYEVPIPATSATRTVTFSDPEFAQDFSVSLDGQINHKRDYILNYVPATLQGPASVLINQPNTFVISPVFGATRYQVTVDQVTPAANDSPSGLTRMIDGTSAGYSGYNTIVRHSDPGAYRFAHTSPVNQFLTYQKDFLVGTQSPGLTFYSRLGWAASSQTAALQVSNDNGQTWDTLFSRVGNSTSGQTSFQLVSRSLSAYAGQRIKIRFGYFYSSGSYYNTAGAGTGWYVDTITFSNLQEATLEHQQVVQAGQHFVYQPVNQISRVLSVRAGQSHVTWPAGANLSVTPVTVPQTTYQTWAAVQEQANSLAPGTLANHPTQDFSGDGISNVQAFAMGLNPIANDIESLPEFAMENGQLQFRYRRNTAAAARVTPELSSDLTEWHLISEPGVPVTYADSFSHYEGDLEHRVLTVPVVSYPRMFVRARALLLE